METAKEKSGDPSDYHGGAVIGIYQSGFGTDLEWSSYEADR